MGSDVEVIWTHLVAAGTWIGSQLSLLVVGGAIGWIGSAAFTWWRDDRARKRGGRALAILLAVTFEEYALACANLIASNNLHQSSGGQDGNMSVKFPELTPFWDSDNWGNLDHLLTERVLTFPNILRQAEISFRFASEMENDDEGDAIDRFKDDASNTALKAWDLACDLRTTYGVVAFQMDRFGWDFVSSLTKAQKEAAELRELKHRNVVDIGGAE